MNSKLLDQFGIDIDTEDVLDLSLALTARGIQRLSELRHRVSNNAAELPNLLGRS